MAKREKTVKTVVRRASRTAAMVVMLTRRGAGVRLLGDADGFHKQRQTDETARA